MNTLQMGRRFAEKMYLLKKEGKALGRDFEGIHFLQNYGALRRRNPRLLPIEERTGKMAENGLQSLLHAGFFKK